MTAIQHYQQPSVPGPFQTSPFKHGDRVKTPHGTGTIYQSGPYDSWVIFDVDWVVKYVRTEFIAHIPGTIIGAVPGYPTVDQLEAAGYTVRDLVAFTLNGQGLDLGQALGIRDASREGYNQDIQDTFRVVSLGDNKYTAVEATRVEPEPWVPVGLG